MARESATMEAWLVLPVLDVLLQATDEGSLVDVLLPRLGRLIPADSILWSMQRRDACAIRVHPESLGGELRCDHFIRNAAADPLLIRINSVAAPVIRRSDVQPDAEYRRSTAYTGVFGMLHAERQLAFGFDAGAGRRGCVILNRSGPEFTAAELLLAEVVRPRLELAVRRFAPAAQPQWITARETAVLDLVVQGLTNRQIATRLGISPRTVGKHLEHSYAKLNEPCRVGAAMRWRAVADGRLAAAIRE